jgi:hypothetical protein
MATWSGYLRSPELRHGIISSGAIKTPLATPTSNLLATSEVTVSLYFSDSLIEGTARYLTLLDAGGADCSRVDWVGPVKSARFAEYRDADFLRQLGLDHLVGAL